MTTEDRENRKRGRCLGKEEEGGAGPGDTKRRRIGDGEDQEGEDRLTPLPDELLLLVDEHMDWASRRTLAATSRRFWAFFDGGRPGVFSKTHWHAATGADRVGAMRLARFWAMGWDPYCSVNLMDKERLRILADLRDADADRWLEDRALLADLFPCYGPERSFATAFKTRKGERNRLKANAVVKALEFAGRSDVLERWADRMPYLGSSEFLNLTVCSGLRREHDPKKEEIKDRTERVPEHALTSDDDIREFLRTATPKCLKKTLELGRLRPALRWYKGASDMSVEIAARILDANRSSLLIASLQSVDWDAVGRQCLDKEYLMLTRGLSYLFKKGLAKPARRAECTALYSALSKEWPKFGSEVLSWVLEDGESAPLKELRDSGILDRVLLDPRDAAEGDISLMCRDRARVALDYLTTLSAETRARLLRRFDGDALKRLLLLAVSDDGRAATTEALLEEIDRRLSEGRCTKELCKWMPSTNKELDAFRRATDASVALLRRETRRCYFLRELASVCMRGITEETLRIPCETAAVSSRDLDAEIQRLDDCLLCARTEAEVDLVYRRAHPALGLERAPWTLYDLDRFLRLRRLPAAAGVLNALYRLAKERAWPVAKAPTAFQRLGPDFVPTPLENRLLGAGFAESVVDRLRSVENRGSQEFRSRARKCYYRCAKLFLKEEVPEEALVGLVEAKLGGDLNPHDLFEGTSYSDSRRVARLLEILETRMVDVEDGAEGTPMRDWDFGDLERLVRAGVRLDLVCCVERARAVRPSDVDGILLGLCLSGHVRIGPDVGWWMLASKVEGRHDDVPILVQSLPSAPRFVEAMRNHPTPARFVCELDAAMSLGDTAFTEGFTNRYRRRAFLRLVAASTGPEELPAEFWTTRFGSYYVEHGWDIHTLEILRRTRSDLDFSALHAHAEGVRGECLKEWLEANRIPTTTRS